jgi:hypothetical protein
MTNTKSSNIYEIFTKEVEIHQDLYPLEKDRKGKWDQNEHPKEQTRVGDVLSLFPQMLN